MRIINFSGSTIVFTFLYLSILFSACTKKDNNPVDTNNPIDSLQIPGYNLVWNDEFNYTGSPDSSKWDYDIGGNGWGNNELQYYTSDSVNARVEEGNLVLEAHYYEGLSIEYTSTRLVSRNKGDWTYGRFEIKAKLPFGRGTWPAIWMLATNWTYGNGGWPDNGEIDIMEHVGYDPGNVHASTHTHTYNWRNGNNKTAVTKVSDFSSAFHLYAMEWTPEKIDIYVDDKKYFTYENDGTGWESWPFDKNFHLILNIAVGGDWGGAQGIDKSIFPQRMEVDYVRVYKAK